jgi:hypothetical protein
MGTNQTLSTILDRARANLNDQAAQLWTDPLLLPHAQNGYSKLSIKIVKVVRSQGEKVIGSPYSPDLQYSPTVLINSIIATAGVAKVECLQPFNFIVGQLVNIAGNTVSGLNGVFPVATVSYSTNQFTFASGVVNTGVNGTAQGTIVDLQSLVPADMWVPITLEWRLDPSEEWTPLNRVHALPSQETDPPSELTNWEYRGRDIFVNQATSNGFLRLRYLSLFPSLIVNEANPAAQSILIDNAVEALAYYTAASAYASRGQLTQAAAMRTEGDDFTVAIKAILIQNMQRIATRSARFSSGGSSTINFGRPSIT